MKTLENCAKELAQRCIREASERHGFDADEEIRILGLENLSIIRKQMVKKPVEKRDKVSDVKKSNKQSFPMPFIKEIVNPNGCQGLAYNRGLFTQCLKNRMENGSYCKGCQMEADKNSSGCPDCGTVEQRLVADLYAFKDPNDRTPVSYVKVLKKLNLSTEIAIEEAGKLNIIIPNDHFVSIEKVDKSSSSRGRPKKVGGIVEADDVIDLFAKLLVSDDNDDADIKNTQDKSENISRSKLSEEEKAIKKAQLEEERTKRKAERDAKLAAEKEEREAKLAAEKEEREAKLAAEKAEKEAKRLAEKNEKEAKLAAEKAEKEAKRLAEKAKKEEVKKESEKEAQLQAERAKKIIEKEAKIASEKAEKEAKRLAEKAEKEAKRLAEKNEKEAKLAAEKAEKEAKRLAEKEANKPVKQSKSKKVTQDTKDIKDTKDTKDTKDIKDTQQDTKDTKDIKDTQQDTKDTKDTKDTQDIKDIKDTQQDTKVDESPPPTKVTVTRIQISGKSYLKSSVNILYDPTTREEVGIWDPETKTIKDLPEEDDEDEYVDEEEEEEYETDDE